MFWLKSCNGPMHETVVKIMPAKDACHCGEIPVADTTRVAGSDKRTADTVIVTPSCKDTTTKKVEQPKPPKKAKKAKAKVQAVAPVPVEQPKPEGCLPCNAAMYAQNTNGESVHNMLYDNMTGPLANGIKQTFGDGEKVIVKCVITVGTDSKVDAVKYTIYKGSENVTSKGNLASMLGVNPVGFGVSYPGANCCTFSFSVVLP
jgi:hypothetical protein